MAWTDTTPVNTAWSDTQTLTDQTFTYLYGTPMGLLLAITQQATGNVTVSSPAVTAYSAPSTGSTAWS